MNTASWMIECAWILSSLSGTTRSVMGVMTTRIMGSSVVLDVLFSAGPRHQCHSVSHWHMCVYIYIYI